MASASGSSRWPKGYGFHPTDEELVNFFLKQKMLGNDHLVTQIAEVNVCDHEPWNLPELSVVKPDHPKWYFFCPRNYKYSNSQRANRTTNAGFWKVTGKDRKIKDIAIKKILVFYEGRIPKEIKTSWVMHEYSLTCALPDAQRNLVLCKLKTDPDNMPALGSGNGGFSSHLVNYDTASYNGQEEDSYGLQANLQPFFGYSEQVYNLNAAMQFKYGE